MRALRLALALVAPCLGLAQLQLFVVDLDGTEKAASAVFQVGQVAAGDFLDTTFRVRNVATVATSFQTLSVAGDGFSLRNKPSLPFTLAAGSKLDFVVRFQPSAAGTYSANLSANNSSTILIGTALPAATVLLDQGTTSTLLAAGTTVDFGRVERGTRKSLHFKLVNQNAVRLSIDTVQVLGDVFAGPVGILPPLTLAPNETAAFDIFFAPVATGLQECVLQVGPRMFLLSGTGTDPPLPKPQIVIGTQSIPSGQQAVLRVKLSEMARVSGVGDLKVDFQPAQANAQDPAILFPSAGSRFATMTVNVGDDWGRFGGDTQIVFQTGATAGTLVFTVRLGDNTDTASVTAPAASVTIDTARGVRSGSNLQVQLTGFDNARSISQLSFTFYDTSGQAVPPGTILYNATTDFQTYFTNNQQAAGGLFSLMAVFPVANGTAASIGAVDVAVTNSVGVTQPPRIQFQ